MSKNPIDPIEQYDKGGISTREFCIKKDLNYAECQAVKYIIRHTEKNGLEDINKAINNLEFLRDNYDWIYKKETK